MEIELTPEQDALMQEMMRKGLYRSPLDVAKAAMSMWEEQERARMELIEELHEADRSIDAGEGIEINSDEELAEFFEEVKRRGRARIAQL